MTSSTIGGIIGVVIFIVGYVLYGIIKSTRQMARLQKIAELYDDLFKQYIYTSMGWQVSDVPHNGWFKLIDRNGYAYYVQFDGPIPFQTAVDLLINGFMKKINQTEREK